MEKSRSTGLNNCDNDNNDNDKREKPRRVNELKLSSSQTSPSSSSSSSLTNYKSESETQTFANATHSPVGEGVTGSRSSSRACGTTSDARDTKLCCVAENNLTDLPPHAPPPLSTFHIVSSQNSSSNSAPRRISSENLSSHIIPGVEHVFFEEELQKMEQKASNEHTNIIVLAADGSAHSELAFQFYKDNVDRPGYYLHVVHHSDVWSHYTISDDGDGPSVDHCKELVEKAKGAVDTVSEKYKKLMETHQIKGETVVLHGKDAWHDIVQHQEKTNAMMIVMGTRGHGALSRTFRGSVSDSVVHHASVPVLVCCHPKDHH